MNQIGNYPGKRQSSSQLTANHDTPNENTSIRMPTIRRGAA